MSGLLIEVVRLLNNTDAQGSARLPEPFKPEKRDVVVNQIWFLSMMLSLVAVVTGTFCLQWISAFLRKDVVYRSTSPANALALRQLRFEGLVGWGVLHAPAVLLLVVQTSIVLFAIGLAYLLWSISHAAARPTIIVGGASAVLLYLANLMPFLQSLAGVVFPGTLAIPQCPFKSPTSWLLHSACVLLNTPWVIPIRQFIPWNWGDTTTQRISFWCDDLGGLLADSLWQWYDKLCGDAREWWGPQHGPWPYSYYLVHGIASAMEILVSKPDAMEIIPSCISVLRQQFRDAKTWGRLFDTKLSTTEKALLEGRGLLEYGEDSRTKAVSTAHIENLRQDFLSAHFFEYLVAHSEKLGRILHRHRIELYIRIKNSGRSFTIADNHLLEDQSDTSEDSDDRDGPVGSSLDCPVFGPEKAQDMSQGRTKY